MAAQSGEEALRLALKNDFAVILLDVRMPGIDGFETAQLIRGRERSRLTPIIFLTAAADEMTSMFRGYEVGAVDYLMKPVVPEVLKSKVSVFVELHRKSERLRESEDKLRRLAAHLISVREEERAHIAREIHDELGQVLTGLKMEVTWLAKRLKEQGAAREDRLDVRADRLDGADGAQDRHRPAPRDARRHGPGRRGRLAGEGVPEAHRHPLPRQAAARDAKLDIDVSTTVFRIFQEILTNVARHSRATRVDIELDVEPTSASRWRWPTTASASRTPSVNGRKSLGLLGMQERALLFGGEVQHHRHARATAPASR